MDDTLIFNDLVKARLAAEAEGQPTWVLWARERGTRYRSECTRNAPRPTEPERVWAHDMVQLLNREIGHDGAWIVGFSHPFPAAQVGVFLIKNPPPVYSRWIFLWVDAEGDPGFTVDNGGQEPFAMTLAATPLHWLGQAEEAWQRWKHQREVLDLRPSDTFKRAQGEAAPSARRYH